MAANKIILKGLARRLVLDGLMTEEAVKQALENAQTKNLPFISYLVQTKILAPAAIASAAANDFGIPFLDLSAYDLELIPKDLVSEKLIRQHRMLPISNRGNRLYLAVSDPTDQNAIEEIQFHTGLNVSTIIVEDDKLEKLVDSILSAQAEAMLGNLDENLEGLEISSGENNLSGENADKEQDAPIIRYVHKILLDAIHQGASDIHFEPYESVYRIRFRVDGILYQIATPPSNLAGRIASRLKVMSQLDISERRIPQDGRFKIKLTHKRAIDFRISTCPTVHGEKVVMRILDPASASLDIDNLGFEPEQKELFLKTIRLPYGMILVTGPTGSGKTITLYTALGMLNTLDRNISTVEDPVEINLTGINQVNINVKTGLTFSTALRSFLRQDPDIIMIGEMRDLETAEIGIKAAQTGHLVLSTLHTNSAPEALTRLKHMGIAPFNIASSVSLIIAQRLARKLCDHCKQPENLPEQTLLNQGFAQEELTQLKTFKAVGCEHCTNGYKGRLGIFEMLPISANIAEIIMDSGSISDIINQAKKQGFQSLHESGLRKVRQGLTSLEELNRIIVE
ncbi:MAG: Type pilus assembly ATPase PilB [Gammaproteobacteria bacterium]|nr:Type pilus assembly ATPase PilB [Gammaproteobacteria bacterium]